MHGETSRLATMSTSSCRLEDKKHTPLHSAPHEKAYAFTQLLAGFRFADKTHMYTETQTNKKH